VYEFCRSIIDPNIPPNIIFPAIDAPGLEFILLLELLNEPLWHVIFKTEKLFFIFTVLGVVNLVLPSAFVAMQ
jgi:hypothetical protein